jgi:hypothetical protein
MASSHLTYSHRLPKKSFPHSHRSLFDLDGVPLFKQFEVVVAGAAVEVGAVDDAGAAVDEVGDKDGTLLWLLVGIELETLFIGVGVDEDATGSIF